jgi:hypothetical protein
MRKFLIAGTVALGSLAMMAPLARAALLASESFDDDTTGTLQGQTGGTGWNTQTTLFSVDAPVGWQNQNLNTDVPGYDVVAPGTALTYSGLNSGPDYAIGGDVYQTTGRMLDVSSGGTFGSNGYLNSGGLIGESGTTLYMSVLMREDGTPGANGGMHVSLFTAPGNAAWYDSNGTNLASELQIGDFGSGVWSMDIDGSGTPISSDVSVVQGQTYLMVVKLQFNGGGGVDVASLYVDPSSLGGADPGSPSASGDGTFDVDSFAYYGGNDYNNSSIDEIRFGSTWADVTPSGAIVGAVPLPAAAWSGLGMLGCLGLAAFGLLRRRVAH